MCSPTLGGCFTDWSLEVQRNSGQWWWMDIYFGGVNVVYRGEGEKHREREREREVTHLGHGDGMATRL